MRKSLEDNKNIESRFLSEAILEEEVLRRWLIGRGSTPRGEFYLCAGDDPLYRALGRNSSGRVVVERRRS